jgi:hypothetical protein
MPLRVSAPSGLVVLVFNPLKSDVHLNEWITYNSHERLSLLRHELHDTEFDSRHMQQNFSSLKLPNWLWDPSSLLLNGYRVHLLAVKQPWREVGHSSPYGAEVKCKWSSASTVPTWLHSMQSTNLPLHYVCLCMYVCIYLCMYVCMYVRMYVCRYVCMFLCTYISVYVCINNYIISFSVSLWTQSISTRILKIHWLLMLSKTNCIFMSIVCNIILFVCKFWVVECYRNWGIALSTWLVSKRMCPLIPRCYVLITSDISTIKITIPVENIETVGFFN